jgi:hypothetical protein
VAGGKDRRPATTTARGVASGPGRSEGEQGGNMRVESMLRLIAGMFVSASVLAGMYVHPAFLWFTLFVGLNLFQSGLSNWCPMMAILRKAGVRD